MRWKNERQYLCLLFWLLLCSALVLRAEDSPGVPKYEDSNKNTEKPALPTSEQSVSFEENLRLLEELAELYLQELNQSEIEWETFLEKYKELQTAVEELMNSVVYWSERFNNLSALYDKVTQTLAEETAKRKALEVAQEVEKLRTDSELLFWKICATVGGVLAIAGWASFAFGK